MMMQCIGCQSGMEGLNGLEGIFNSSQQFIAREQQWQQLNKQLSSMPADIDVAVLIPERVADFRRVATDKQSNIAWLGIEADGFHARYQRDAADVDLYAWPVSDLEREALMRRVHTGSEDASAVSKFTTGLSADSPGETKPILGSRASFEISPPTNEGTFFWTKGWLFLSNSNGGVDSDEFLRKYLVALRSATEPAPEMTKSPLAEEPLEVTPQVEAPPDETK